MRLLRRLMRHGLKNRLTAAGMVYLIILKNKNMKARMEIINSVAYIKGNYNEWVIDDHDEGVSIEVDGSDYLVLDQTELKQLIEFLQSKVK